MRTVAALALIVFVVWPGWAVTSKSRHLGSGKAASAKITGFAKAKKAGTANKAGSARAGHKAAVPSASAKVSKTGAKSRSRHSAGRSGRSSTGKSAANRSGAQAKTAGQTWRGGQMAPSSDRYKEIQEALTAKGYAAGSPDGVWGPEWSSSLKRFQQDRKLEPSGKLTSLSLITLGLGPRRETSESPAAAPVPENSSSDSVTREIK